ncbi:MAG: terpene cyclase/mutase family protein [Verrucomicrobia bacterium]|nr:terpene cyclase/mutase family protein [Verrucomicrobiota bacterium]
MLAHPDICRSLRCRRPGRVISSRRIFSKKTDARFEWSRHVAILCFAFTLFVLSPPPLRAQGLFEEQSDVIPDEVERMYLKGLKCLVQTQAGDGSWPGQYGTETAVVGLAVLSMLAHGDDPNVGPYSQAIRRGIEFILSHRNQQNGYIGTSMYNHGFATLALAEAYGAVRDPRLGPALQQAVALILTSQSHNPQGAWRYSPESTDADTTVSGAQLVALFAARNAGIAVPEEAIQRALKFFLRCQSPDGGFGYTNASGPNAPRSAIGALMLCLAREQKSSVFKSALRYLNGIGIAENNYHFYYLYYASQAFFQASLDAWHEWNSVNIKSLAATQEADGGWNGQLGPTFSTSAALLSLALNYRFLPIYER